LSPQHWLFSWAWRLEALLHLSCLKPCNTVYLSIRRHAATAGM
jgi:hypothetical protein